MSDYNIFYRSGNRGIPFWWNWGAMNWRTLQEWRDQTGNDEHSIVAEPRFKNAQRKDFHPASQSPAILFTRPSMDAPIDFDGKRRDENSLLTAGPYQAEAKLLPGPRPTPIPQFRTIPLESAQPLPQEFAGLSDVIARELPAGKLPDGQTGFLLKDAPFTNGARPTAATLDKNRRSLRMGVWRNATTMHFALGLLNSGKAVPLRCRIARQDGAVVELKWEAGKSIGPSLGPWDGTLAGGERNLKTEVGWQSRDGRARIYVTTWHNDNEWYPLQEIEWILDDEDATVLIFGVTAK